MRLVLALCSIVSCFALPSLKEMTLEEKVGQVLMVCFQGDTANETARRLVQDIKVGGIIYYNWANGLVSPEQIRTLSQGLQKMARIPLWIAADQEGGVVSRCKEGFTEFPGNRALGVSGHPDWARMSAVAVGKELKAVGINMNLAPVVDVNCNEKNPVLYSMPSSFSLAIIVPPEVNCHLSSARLYKR